jgi:hypothetical protein
MQKLSLRRWFSSLIVPIVGSTIILLNGQCKKYLAGYNDDSQLMLSKDIRLLLCVAHKKTPLSMITSIGLKTMSSTSRQVSFSENTVVILFPSIHRRENPELWHSTAEVQLSKVVWVRSIQKAQSMDLDMANITDATDYMGLERYLSKNIQKHCVEEQRDYIQSVIAMQHNCLIEGSLAAFAQSKSRAAVERSHSIGVFHMNRHFQSEQEAANSIHKSKMPKTYSSKSSDCNYKMKIYLEKKGIRIRNGHGLASIACKSPDRQRVST